MRFTERWRVWGLAAVLVSGVVGQGVRPLSAATAPTVRIAVEGEVLRLAWGPAGEDARFTVETTPGLAPAQWQALGGAAGWPTAATNWSGPLPATGAAYFRVVVGVPPGRGALETTALVRSFTRAEMDALLRENNVPGAAQYGVDAWKVVYRTIDPEGVATRASALVVVPTGAGKPLPFVSYQHGTITLRDDVPSRLNEEGELGLILATGGYVAVLPDYLGLGDSPGLHPYHHAASEATAAVDALRAARALVGELNVAWNGQLFLTGYSQGGHVALATQRELELHHAGEFTLTASAPAAGAYDLSGVTTEDFLSNRIPPNPYYYAYLLAAYVEVYGVAPDLASLLKAPYDRQVPPLFDGAHDGGQMNAVLPARPADMLKPEVLAAFRDDPNHPLRLALRDNDLYRGWVPQTPTRFFHCKGDQDVLFANSQAALDAFKAAGSKTVELIDPLSFADHGGCVPFALLQIKFWFDGLKR